MSDDTERARSESWVALCRGAEPWYSSGVLGFLFGLSEPVGRRVYAITGVVLMLLKYAGDAALVWWGAHVLWSPIEYLSPALFVRETALRGPDGSPAPTWLLVSMAVWTLPFLWIGVSMSIRRVADAGHSGWLGLLFFVPLVNYLFMIAMCFIPSRPRLWVDGEGRKHVELVEHAADESLRSALVGLAAGVAIALAMVGVSVLVLGHYGTSLFFGTPFVVGVVTGHLFNRKRLHSLGATIGVVSLAVALGGCAMLLFALEGLVCIAMAYPLAAGTAILGGLLGRSFAFDRAAPALPAMLCALGLPFLAGAESATVETPLREVLSTIEVDAAPDAVWPNVIGFSDLPPPAEWIFSTGIAYPKRARIFGTGVGAVRHCEFSTGPFVEPITVWDAPSRLAFDVRSQPAPMEEWSPYRHVHPPHLDGTMRSKRGEFRLIPLEGGRTRIEARTWYELEIFPQPYWVPFADALVGSIHHRVLEHVKALSEGRRR